MRIIKLVLIIFSIAYFGCKQNGIVTTKANNVKPNVKKTLILLSDFDEVLKIEYGCQILFNGVCKTEESTGSSKVGVRLNIDPNNLSHVYIYSESNMLLYKFDPNREGENIYIWRLDGHWKIEFTNEFLYFE